MKRAGTVDKIPVGSLSAKNPPAGIQKPSHVQKVESAKGVEVKEKGVGYQDEDQDGDAEIKFPVLGYVFYIHKTNFYNTLFYSIWEWIDEQDKRGMF